MHEPLTLGIWLAITLMPFGSAAVIASRTQLLGGFKLMFVLCVGLSILTLNLLAAGAFGSINLWKVGVPQSLLLGALLAPNTKRKLVAFGLPKPTSGLDPATVLGILTGAIGALGLLIAVTHVAPRCDSVDLHLPMARWIRDNGVLRIPDSVRDATRPAGFSLLYAWATCASNRLELLALINVGYSLLLGLAAFNTARVLGCSRRVSIWAPALILGNYVLTDQVIVLYIDTALAAFLLAAFAFGLGYQRVPRTEFLFGSALAAGLAFGGKVQGIAFAPILLLPIIISPSSTACNIRAKVRALGIWVAAALLICGIWPARNAILTGSIAHEGAYTASFTMRTALLFNLPDYAREHGVARFVRDAAGQTSWTALGSIIPLLLLVFTRRGTAEKLGVDNGVMTVFVMGTLISLALVLVHPCTARHFPHTELLVGGQLRYGIFTFALMSVCWVLVLSKIPAWLPVLCVGLALPGSRTATTLGLAATGVVAALAKQNSEKKTEGEQS